MTVGARRPDRAPPLGLYARLFDALERDGIDYCVWKNLNELPDALGGRGDIDLHVRPHSRAAFLDLLRAHGFLRVETHKGHPWIAHFYGFDGASGTLCHLHCYFRIVTGESHIKQYVVPVERYLDALPAVRNALGVREMHPWLQRRLHLFRRRIKLSCLPGALLFHRERAGYRAEHELLGKRGDEPAEGVPTDGWAATIAESSSLREDLANGFAYRLRFASWSRFAPFTTPLQRYGVIPVRALGKWLGWRKTLPFGLLVMVTGEPDRVERTRAELDDRFGPAFRLHAFRLPGIDTESTPRRLLQLCRHHRSTLRAAVRSAANGALAVCYLDGATCLRDRCAAAAGAPGTPHSTRRALERCAVRLDDGPEPDVVLRAGNVVVPPALRRGATLVEVGGTSGWQQAFWQALVERQHR